MNNIISKNSNDEKEIAIRKAREKLKNIIKENDKFNLRDLSRILKKNDAYLQQYLFRGTPRILPEECRYRLAQTLEININEITPNWYAQNLVENKIITFENIEKKYSSSPRKISLSEELLSDILPTNLEKLFYFQTHTHDYKITTIVDTNVNEYIGPNLYLLNDKDTFFLAYVKESELKDNRMNVKPFLKTFHSFHIASKLLKISAKVLWQSSKIIYE
ncbi:MAG: hypothetical protein L7T23_06285 [Alphaproteobacteria bacterium]|jgi:hypothetical protein|nr:hypothetical protein [Alphaproteobacteria bacterium]